ncbi:LOW QUALITY PROTEIN: unc-112-related protein-like [Rhipicephalus sanguineus]|uniref:LOW QUALITY PROTEIN: unc-112-related protein-like n=1 Tax=Rhipicephalus sanguineus TaxID=34632 RepID=UPI0018959BED|nr:LOW QUALITY PROTEIN: unc-112-related protein-like [Rhipicephalus sanguineus]
MAADVSAFSTASKLPVLAADPSWPRYVYPQLSNMIADGVKVDGSWELCIHVTDLKLDRKLRVKGDMHIGGVMLQLVESLNVPTDWSDHALWWPEQNTWLTRTKSTLDQCGVMADALLHFTPMHKTLRIQFPDLRIMDVRTDFSVKTFSAVVKVCKELGIRHPEELSFCRPLVNEHLKRNYRAIGCSPRQRPKEGTDSIQFNRSKANDSNGTLDGALGSPHNSSVTHWNTSSFNNGIPPGLNGSYLTPENSFSSQYELPLAQSPNKPPQDIKAALLRPKTLVERARLNAGWLDSSLSLMEQDVREFDLLQLRYKFYSFYDLNPRKDAVRINQIYEQARWALLTEEIDCTEEEMMLFAALQLQVNLQANSSQPDFSQGEDDIDAALTDLQVTLEGSAITSETSNITQVPELHSYLRFLRPKRFTLKGFKRMFFIFKETRMCIYKSREEYEGGGSPSYVINLKGSEVTPDVYLAEGKYGIRLEVPGPEGMTEYWLRCETEDQYAQWMAGCRLAAKGKTMADASYEAEVHSIQEFLQLQRPAPAPALLPSQLDIDVEDFVAPRFIKKLKSKQAIVQRIVEAHGNVKDLSLVDAKMNFIKAWQALPEFGISLFVVRFSGSKKEELLGVAFNRLMRMELSTGDHIKTWRFNTMMAWNVNWEVKQMNVQFEEDQRVAFSCLSADCKTVHEFIGGYIFLSMRSKDQNQTLNEELFHKLTGGWV